MLTWGCLPEAVNPTATPVTAVDPRHADPDFFFQQPATEQVSSPGYDALWNAAQQAAVSCSFTVEREDYRTGLMTTKPLVSRQFFEFWKQDVADPYSQVDSDLATHRRVVHFDIHEQPDGVYVCEPRVIVERYEMSERRITAVYQYQDAFSFRRGLEQERNDQGQPVRPEYWYPERRDAALEHVLAERMRAVLKNAPPADQSPGRAAPAPS